MLICMQKINFILHNFTEISQRYCNLVILSTLGMSGYVHSKWYYQLVENFRVFLQAKKWTSLPTFFWRYCKDMKTSYFGYFEHAWLCTHKMIEPTCRKRQCLSACHKYFSLFTSFLKYCILKNLVIWLANNILTHNSRTRILPDMELVVKYQ